MSETATTINENAHFFTQINTAPYVWLITAVSPQACALWVLMRGQAPTYNHFPAKLAESFGVSTKTAQRWLKELHAVGAVFRVRRAPNGGQDCVYYRALEIPADYRKAVREAQKTAPNKEFKRAEPVDKSKERKKTNLSPLIRLNSKSNNYNNTPAPALPTTTLEKPRIVDNCGGEYVDYRMFFDLIMDEYPQEKRPNNPKYLNATFNQFKIHVHGMNYAKIELFTDTLIMDIQTRKAHSPHWLMGNIPNLFGYFKESRWLLPIGAPIAHGDDLSDSPMLTAARERFNAMQALTDRPLQKTQYVTADEFKRAFVPRTMQTSSIGGDSHAVQIGSPEKMDVCEQARDGENVAGRDGR